MTEEIKQKSIPGTSAHDLKVMGIIMVPHVFPALSTHTTGPFL